MMKALPVILFLLIAVFSCNNESEKKSDDSVKTTKSGSSCSNDPVNPNGSSELAILMRQMAAITDSVKTDLMNHREARPMLENISTILTAKKTDKNIDKNIFNPFAEIYLARINDFYGAKPEQKTEQFNNMVNACISCHQNFCGGPIKRIKKLFIPVK